MNIVREYTESTGIEHRRRFAQFFTPPEIARFMTKWVLSGRNGDGIHDPAFGLGAFMENAPGGCVFTGGDADELILSFYRNHSGRQPASLKHTNYLLDFGSKYDNIVCNPPYLRFQKFSNRDAVSAAFRERFGVCLSGYTNIASAFLIKSIFDLKPGGRLAYIMPSEFLNAGYGAIVKEHLTKNGHLDSIIEISCEKEAFDEVVTSVCIILYDSSRAFNSVSFRRVDSLADFDAAIAHPPASAVPLRWLDPKAKWGRFFVPEKNRAVPARKHLTALKEYGRFSRGIATGANGFFVLSRPEIFRRGIPQGDCRPCITKSCQLKGSVFTDGDFELLAGAGAAVYLFSPGDKPSPGARQYIEYGESLQFDKRFITRHRTPWYKTESRAVSPLLLNVFSRNGYKVVRNYSSALSLTNFHCFYPNPLSGEYVDWIFLYLLSSAGRKILSLSKRTYGDSLDKFEPNDLNSALVPNREFFDSLGEKTLAGLMLAANRGDCLDGELDSIFAPLLLSTDKEDRHMDSIARNDHPEAAVQLRLAL